MERAATGIDVAAVGSVVHGDDGETERAKELRREFAGRAVRAIQNNLHSREARAGKDCSLKPLEIILVQFSSPRSSMAGAGPAAGAAESGERMKCSKAAST